MKIVVIGGSGLIGTKLVNNLRQLGHEVVAASPRSGINTITGEGLADALTGAQVVVDVANSPSFEDKPVMEFFETSSRNLLSAEATFFYRVVFIALSIFIALFIFATLPVFAASANDFSADTSNNTSKVTLVFDRALPNVPGKSIKGVLVEYQPGGSSPAHTHPDSSFIYATVLEGAIRSQINDNPVQVYHAGENFFEVPSDRHRVSANASETQPMRMLAVFVVDTNETNLVINDKE